MAITREVKPFGSGGAHIILPKAFISYKVTLEIVETPQGIQVPNKLEDQEKKTRTVKEQEQADRLKRKRQGIEEPPKILLGKKEAEDLQEKEQQEADPAQQPQTEQHNEQDSAKIVHPNAQQSTDTAEPESTYSAEQEMDDLLKDKE